MLTGFARTRWPRLRFSESYAVRISVKISRICEFRVIMGIMTGLLGCCSSSTLGSRANDYVKTLATLEFWLHHSPCPLGCWTNNTLAARSLSPKYTILILCISVYSKLTSTYIAIYHSSECKTNVKLQRPWSIQDNFSDNYFIYIIYVYSVRLNYRQILPVSLRILARVAYIPGVNSFEMLCYYTSGSAGLTSSIC